MTKINKKYTIGVNNMPSALKMKNIIQEQEFDI
jgi:hypothetical protein